MEKRNLLNNKGFSLVELIIVIAIMAILAATVGLLLVRYIEKARKEIDVQNAQMLYEAASLAAATSNDEAAEGWSIVADPSVSDYSAGYAVVTNCGHRGYNASMANTYTVRLVAWCRGIQYDGDYGQWENSLFKAGLDGASGNAAKQRAYTDEFLANLNQESAAGGYSGGDGKHRTFDGYNDGYVYFKWKKASKLIDRRTEISTRNYKGGSEEKQPECWCIFRRDDNGACEIWLGYKDGNVKPLYRLYPDTCAEYR